MKERTKNQKEWLQEQNRDQNLQGLENLANTEKNDEGRKWYPSQVIQPTAPIARFNHMTGKYEVGTEDHNADVILNSAVAAQNTDYVITNGETWELKYAGALNGTQASYIIIYYSDDGANFYPLNQVSIASVIGLPGGSFAGTCPLRFTGDGTALLRITLATFAAGNTTRTTLVYRRVN